MYKLVQLKYISYKVNNVYTGCMAHTHRLLRMTDSGAVLYTLIKWTQNKFDYVKSYVWLIDWLLFNVQQAVFKIDWLIIV
jgi:hypothetical protein